MPGKAAAPSAANQVAKASSTLAQARGASSFGPPQLTAFTQLQRNLGNQAMQQLLESGAIQAKLRISQPGDADELEADRVANHIVHCQHPPTLQRKCSCAGSCAKCEDEELKGIHRKAASPPTLHRASSDPSLPRTDSAGAKPSARGLSRPSQLIVEDSAKTLEHGQMRKSEFLKLMRSAVCTTADAALASVKHSTKACPYIEKWLAFYSEQDGVHIERALTKYAPEAARVRTAREYISFLNTRVERAVLHWAKTGKLTGVPDELASQFLPGASPGGFLGSLMHFASSGVGSSILGFLGGSSKKHEDSAAAQKEEPASSHLQRKESGAADPAAHDAHAVKSQLGSGRPLDSRVQSQMSSAFSYDFSEVRVHSDSQSAAFSADLNAKAFTIGRDVAFGSGEYRPGTPAGDMLIAHELAHVVQQGGSQASAPLAKSSTNDSPLERDADLASLNAVAALWSGGKSSLGKLRQNAMPRLRAGLSLQRCSKDKGHDFEVRGVSPDPDSKVIFFDQKSSNLDKSQEPKIPPLKTPPAQDLTLHSFVSEDENSPAAGGVKLATERFKTVDKALRASPNPHTGGQAQDLNTTSGIGNSDYRSMRKVLVKPTGVATGVPNCSAGGEVACADPDKFKSAQTKAESLLTHAIARLSGPLLPATKALLTDRFGARPATIAGVATAVKSNLTKLKTHIKVQMKPLGTKRAPARPGHRCANACEGCQPGTVAFNNGTDADALMTLCDNSGGGFMNEPNLVTRADTLIHEGLHGITLASVPVLLPPPAIEGTTDFSYEDQRLIKFLDPSIALQNTDSYVLLVDQLNGLPVTVGRAAADPASGVPLSPGIGGEREQVDRALGWLEGWLTWSEQEVSGIYESINKALKRVPPKWPPAGSDYYEEAMTKLAPVFGLTVPPTAPTERDKFAVAAIHDRYDKMQGVVFSTASIAINRKSTGTTSWASGPKRALTLGPDFFAFPAGPGRDRAQLDLLLRTMIAAHPDISEGARSKYFIMTDLLRKHFGGGSP